MITKSAISQNDFEKLIYASISDSIAVIDPEGDIQYVNEGWKNYAQKNACLIYDNWQGYNYLSECKKAIALGEKLGEEAMQGICNVIEGKQENYYMEYPCNSPLGKQWFLMRVSGLGFSQSQLFLIRHTNISERKLAEELVQEKKKAILKAIPDIMFLHDENGNYLQCFANDPSLLLRPISEIVGSNLTEILPEELANKIMACIRKTLAEKNLNQFEYSLEINSKIMHFEARFVLCQNDKVLSIVRDVTERKKIEMELEKMHSRYSAVVEDQTEFICRFSSDTRLTFVNEAYCNFFGKTKDELLGKQFITLLPEPDQEIALKNIKSLSPELPTAVYRHKVYDKIGEICWQEWVDRAIFDVDGKLIEYQSVGRDISERVAVEKELDDQLDRGRILNEEIKKRSEDLKNSNIELEKLNTTLAMMLDYARKTEVEIQERVVSNLRLNILSILEILRKEKLSTNANELIELLEYNTKKLAQPLANKLDSLLLGLTSREMQLAALIRQGKTNKEIMGLLNLSFQTVQSHRNNLRKKLGLCNKKVNLRTYLNTEFQIERFS